MEAINLVLAKCQMTTVLGVATDMLYRAIHGHYSSTAKKQGADSTETALEGAVQLGYLVPLDIKQARKYLQKIVQVSICLLRRHAIKAPFSQLPTARS